MPTAASEVGVSPFFAALWTSSVAINTLKAASTERMAQIPLEEVDESFKGMKWYCDRFEHEVDPLPFPYNREPYRLDDGITPTTSAYVTAQKCRERLKAGLPLDDVEPVYLPPAFAQLNDEPALRDAQELLRTLNGLRMTTCKNCTRAWIDAASFPQPTFAPPVRSATTISNFFATCEPTVVALYCSSFVTVD